LIGNECRGPNPRKSAVVPTKSILTAANMPIIGGHHVLALQSPPAGWQATSLLVLLCHFLIHQRPLLPQTAGTSGQRFDQSDGKLTADA
jgi:hypothetical protein